MRNRNESLIFSTILTQGPISRIALQDSTDLSPATVTKVVKRLLDQRLIEEIGLSEDPSKIGPRRSGSGRRPKLLRIRKNQPFAVGVRVMPDELKHSGGQLLGVITDLEANVLAQESRGYESDKPEALVKDIIGLTKQLLDLDRAFKRNVKGLGVEVGGHVDLKGGIVRFSPNLDWHEPVPLISLLREQAYKENVSLAHIVIENDVNALAVYEQWFSRGWAEGVFAVVWVGSGIGAGLVLNNELVHGSSGGAGELGHVVVHPKGERCRCGAYGCLETVASIPALVKAIRTDRNYSEAQSVQQLDLLARTGDLVTQQVLRSAGQSLGHALSTLINLFNPSKVILSGPAVVRSERTPQDLVVFSDEFMDGLHESLQRHCFPNFYERERTLEVKDYSDEKGAQGAASSVLRKFIQDPL